MTLVIAWLLLYHMGTPGYVYFLIAILWIARHIIVGILNS